MVYRFIGSNIQKSDEYISIYLLSVGLLWIVTVIVVAVFGPTKGPAL